MDRPVDEKGLEELLDRCVYFHGHLCVGQALGVRLALKGMELAGVSDPRHMIVFIENDRCIADAVQIVTGSRIGRRSAKLVNAGKMAVTVLNTKTGDAHRVNVRRLDAKPEMSPDDIGAILHVPDSDLMAWRRVVVSLRPEELPGKPRRTVACAACGEKVFDGRDVPGRDGPLCRPCAEGAYYTLPANGS